jgi:hypothetical protein
MIELDRLYSRFDPWRHQDCRHPNAELGRSTVSSAMSQAFPLREASPCFVFLRYDIRLDQAWLAGELGVTITSEPFQDIS